MTVKGSSQKLATSREDKLAKTKGLITIGMILIMAGILGFCFQWEIAKIVHKLFSIGFWQYSRTVNIVILISAVTSISGVVVTGNNAIKLSEL